MSKPRQILIDGQWTDSKSGDTFEDRNPADSNDLIGTFQRATEADAARAVKAAVAAQDEWSSTPGPERGRILTRAAEHVQDRAHELTETLVREEGKTLNEAANEVQRAADIFYYFGSKARDIGGDVKAASSRNAHLYTVDEPLGVVALITPWNYPIAIPAWKLGPALATGNTVVFKPASLTPEISRNLVQCLVDAGLPNGVINYVTGPGSAIGGTFSTHEAIDGVSFTGSSQVGNTVYEQATSGQKRIQTEMGGKNVAVVTESADIDVAADIVSNGAFGVTGQACTATSRAIVLENSYQKFVAAVVERAEAIEVGSDLDNSDMGPQASKSELEGTLEYVQIGRDEGAVLETGGSRVTSEAHTEGFFVEPTVFSGVDPSMQIAQEEIFGPVLGVIPASDFDEAIEIANGVTYGLSASVVTKDHTEANRFVDEIETGVAKINEKTTGSEVHVPFGGLKDSSSETYREQGDAGLDFFTITKTVYDNY